MKNIKIDAVEEIIREVADTIVVPRFGHLKQEDIHFKGPNDPWTIADQEAEIALRERLIALLPGSKVVGEEAFSSNRALLDLFSDESPVWTIDPIDGTKAFMRELPLYGVIVSLTKQNQTLAGWLYDPTSKEFVTAEQGSGAYYQGEKLRALLPQPLEKMRGTLGNKLGKKLQSAIDKNAFRQQGPLLQPGLAACHDYASLLVGIPHFSGRTTQIHFRGKLSCTPWDNAAGVMIHAEAGGYSAHLNGDPYAPGHFDRPLLSAPDKESWRELRDWIKGFCAV